MIAKENISKTLMENNSVPQIHNLMVLLGFDLHKMRYVKYLSHEDIVTVESTKRRRSRELLNHFSSRNEPFYKKKGDSWGKAYREVLRKNKKDNLAMYQHKKSQMILLDIDCHGKPTTEENLKLTVLNIVEELRTVFNNSDFSPHLIEISKLKRGIHIYIPMDKQFEHDSVQYFLQKFKLYFEDNNPGFKMEWRTPTKAVRLPFVIDYSIYRYENDSLVRTSFINLDKIETHSLNVDIANCVLESMYGKNKLVIFERDVSYTLSNYTDFSMYRGNRVERHLALARYCHANSLPYSEFELLSREWNRGSKDLTYNFTKTCQSVWKSTKDFKINATANTIPNFISNLSHLTKSHIGYIEGTISANSYRYSHANQSCLKRELAIFSKELFGYLQYQKEKPRRVRKNARITRDKRKKMCVGFQFPISLQEKIIENYKLTSSQRNLFKHFCSLFLVQYKHNERGWSEGCCRQYTERKTWIKNISNYYSGGLVTSLYGLQSVFLQSFRKVVSNSFPESHYLYGHAYHYH